MAPRRGVSSRLGHLKGKRAIQAFDWWISGGDAGLWLFSDMMVVEYSLTSIDRYVLYVSVASAGHSKAFLDASGPNHDILTSRYEALNLTP